MQRGLRQRCARGCLSCSNSADPAAEYSVVAAALSVYSLPRSGGAGRSSYPATPMTGHRRWPKVPRMRAVERDVVMRDSGLRDGLQSIARIPRAKAGQTVETTLFPPTLDGERLRLFRTTSWRPFMSDRRAFTLHAVRLTAAAIAAPAFATKAFAADFTMRISHQFPPAHQTAQATSTSSPRTSRTATHGRVDVQLFGAGAAVQAEPEPPGGRQRQDRSRVDPQLPRGAGRFRR